MFNINNKQGIFIKKLTKITVILDKIRFFYNYVAKIHHNYYFKNQQFMEIT